MRRWSDSFFPILPLFGEIEHSPTLLLLLLSAPNDSSSLSVRLIVEWPLSFLAKSVEKMSRRSKVQAKLGMIHRHQMRLPTRQQLFLPCRLLIKSNFNGELRGGQKIEASSFVMFVMSAAAAPPEQRANRLRFDGCLKFGQMLLPIVAPRALSIGRWPSVKRGIHSAGASWPEVSKLLLCICCEIRTTPSRNSFSREGEKKFCMEAIVSSIVFMYTTFRDVKCKEF